MASKMVKKMKRGIKILLFMVPYESSFKVLGPKENIDCPVI